MRKPRKVLCEGCDKVFVPPHYYAEGEVFDCPYCGRRQTMRSYALNTWYIYGLPPLWFVLKIVGGVLYVFWVVLCFLVKFAFQAFLGIMFVKLVHGVFRSADNALHGEPPLGRRKM